MKCILLPSPFRYGNITESRSLLGALAIFILLAYLPSIHP